MTNYGVFDGSTYAVAGSEDNHDGNTVSGKIIYKPTATDGSLCGKYDYGTGQREYYVKHISDGRLNMFYCDDGINFDGQLSTITSNIGEWNELEFVYDSDNLEIRIILNGVSETLPMSGSGIFQGTAGFTVGSILASGSGIVPFIGDIAYVKSGYAEFKFDSDFGTTTLKNTGTAGGDATLSGATLTDFWQTDYSGLTEVKNGYGVFDGTTYTEGGTSAIHDGTGIIGRVIFKPVGITTFQALIAKYNSVAATNLESILFIDSSGYVVGNFRDGSGNTASEKSTIKVRAGEWNDVSFVLKGNDYSVTINGVTEDFVIAAPYTGVLNLSAAPVTMGSWNDTNYPFEGDMAYAQLGTAKYNFVDYQDTLKVKNIGYTGNEDYRNYGVFDGVTYATGNTDDVFDGSTLRIEAILNVKSLTQSFNPIVAKFTASGSREFLLAYRNDGRLLLTYVDTSDTVYNEYILPAGSITLGFHTIVVNIVNGEYTVVLDGVALGSGTLDASVIASDTGATLTLAEGAGAAFSDKLDADLYYLKAGNAEFDFNDEYGTTTLVNTGTAGGNATITGATLTEFWGSEDARIRNYYDGFWQSSDAKLVQSHCGKFDGSTYAKTGTGIVTHTAASIDISVRFKFVSDNLGQVIAISSDASDVRNWLIQKITSPTNEIAIGFYDSAGTFTTTNVAQTLKDTWYSWRFVLADDVVTVTDTDTGALINTFAYTAGIRMQPDSFLTIGATALGVGDWTGNICDVNVGGNHFPMAEGAGSTLYPILEDENLYNYGVFDGSAYATMPAKVWEVGQTLEFTCQLNVPSQAYVFSGANLGVQLNVNTIYVYAGGTLRSLSHFILDTHYHDIKIIRETAADYHLYIDGVFLGITGDDSSELSFDFIGKRIAGSPYIGNLAYARLSNAWEYKFKDNFGTTTLINTGVDGGDATLVGATLATFWGNNNATLTGATLTDFWSETQDVYHYNILNGFDCYDSANGEVKVPIGVEPGTSFVQCEVAEYLDENGGGATGNGNLSWTGSVIDEATFQINVTEGAYGTEFDSSSATQVYFDNADIVAGKTYNYYVKSKTSASSLYATVGGTVIGSFGTGTYVGQIVAGAGTGVRILNNGVPVNVTLEQFYVWEDGTLPSFSPTNPAGKWHNGAETAIQFPELLQDIQDSVPVTSLTKNASLRWVGGELDEFETVESGTGTIAEEPEGTKFETSGDYIGIYQLVDFKAGEDYNYYIEVTEYTSGSLSIDANTGTNLNITGTGVYTGVHSQLVDYGQLNLKRTAGATNLTISKYYLWKEGTIPPLFYDEFEADFNDAHQVFSNIEDKKKRSITFYNTPLSGSELEKVYKCTDDPYSRDEDGNTLYDENGDPILLT